jgi:hypothetical protein
MSEPSDSPRQRFRATVLPWLLVLLLACAVAYLGFRAYRGLPTRESPYKGDFEHFYYAALAVSRDEDLYASHTRGYIYPPLLATILAPLASLDLRSAQLVWGGFGLAMTGLSLWMSVVIARRRLGVPNDLLTTLALLVVTMILWFEPLRQEIEEGQTDTVVCLGLVGALLALDRRPWQVGILIGLAANVKYQALIVLPYLLFRKRWREAIATGLGTVLFALVPAITLGWSRNLEYLAVAFRGVSKLLGVSTTGEAVVTHDIRWEKSISVTSGFARILGDKPGDAVPVALALVVASIVAGIGRILYSKRGACLLRGRFMDSPAPSHGGIVAVEWSLLITAVLAFSPQTTVRHMFIFLPCIVFTSVVLVVPREGVPRRSLALAVLLLILGMLLPPGNVESMKPALDAWRFIGGTAWCLLIMALTFVWYALAYARAVDEGRPLLDPPPRA